MSEVPLYADAPALLCRRRGSCTEPSGDKKRDGQWKMHFVLTFYEHKEARFMARHPRVALEEGGFILCKVTPAVLHGVESPCVKSLRSSYTGLYSQTYTGLKPQTYMGVYPQMQTPNPRPLLHRHLISSPLWTH